MRSYQSWKNKEATCIGPEGERSKNPVRFGMEIGGLYNGTFVVFPNCSHEIRKNGEENYCDLSSCKKGCIQRGSSLSLKNKFFPDFDVGSYTPQYD
jgi:hypothetical protein